jgi:DNA-binding response OmpR family regulator
MVMDATVRTLPALERRVFQEVKLHLVSPGKIKLQIRAERERTLRGKAVRMLWALMEQPGTLVSYTSLGPILRRPGHDKMGRHTVNVYANRLEQLFADSGVNACIAVSVGRGVALCKFARPKG